MYHNVLNFPGISPDRADTLRKILQYTKPDVYVVNELESATGADLILDYGLNVFGSTNYSRAAFIDGYDTDNGLFYNSDKLGLVDQLQLGTVLRDISVYQLYYKAPNLTAQSDTIYFWFFSCHLKAGSADFDQRNTEAQQVKFYLNSIAGKVENVFVGGDFNFYSGFESGSLTLQNSGAVPLLDPVSAIGNWSGDAAYVDWHTQSTRISSVGGGSGGGMDDRFDLIFVSEDVLNNENGVSYLAGSYQALGQDGNRMDGTIISPSNVSVPDSVSNALYWASDHLPVLMTVVLDETASSHQAGQFYTKVYYDASTETIEFITPFENMEVVLYDMSGRVVLQASSINKHLPIPKELAGVYVFSILADGVQFSDKIVIAK